MTQSQPTKPYYRTESYGKKSIIISYINCWNKTQKMLAAQSLKSLYRTKIKNMLTNGCIHKFQKFIKILPENCIRIGRSS